MFVGTYVIVSMYRQLHLAIRGKMGGKTRTLMYIFIAFSLHIDGIPLSLFSYLQSVHLRQQCKLIENEKFCAASVSGIIKIVKVRGRV